MIRKHIVRDYLGFLNTYYGFREPEQDKKEAYIDLRERMCISAIRDNGIFKTFRFSKDNDDIILSYIKIEDTDIKSYPDMFEKQSKFRGIYLCNQTNQSIQEYQDILNSCLMYNEINEIDDTLKHEFEVIKERCVKDFDAVYSTVKIDNIDINKDPEIIFIHYSYYYIKDKFIDKLDLDDVVSGKASLPYGEWFTSKISPINNLSSDPAEESEKDKGVYAWCHASIFPERNTDYSENTLNKAKENKNMRMLVHLLIVPKGMSEEFVNITKKNLQSDDSSTLYVSSNDIAFEPNDRFKTKYDLLEYWVKSGEIHCVEFMIGYENDPEAKAFEAFIRGFIRGIKTNSTSVDTVNLWYQKDTIERAVNNLRSDCNKSSIIRSNLNSITDTIMDKVKVFKEYGLKDNDLDIIRNADCDRKDAYNATVDKITEIAFASDKKGTKKK